VQSGNEKKNIFMGMGILYCFFVGIDVQGNIILPIPGLFAYYRIPFVKCGDQ